MTTKTTTKAITSKYSECIYTIERADWSIRFYDYETRRHYERKVWFHSSDIFVQFKGQFVSIVTERDGKYDPWVCSEYTEVSADELREMAYKALAHRNYSVNHSDYSFEEVTQVYAYAMIAFDANKTFSMFNVVDDRLYAMRYEATTEQAEEPVEQEAAEEEAEATTIKIIDTYKRFTAEDATWQSAHAASIEAERYHDQTGEPVQYANHDGVVLGYIDADGRRFGSYATCG